MTLLDSKNKVKTIYPIFSKELSLSIQPIDIEAEKINNTTLDHYDMVVAAFSITDKANYIKFFEEIFKMANISLEIVLKMLFFISKTANINPRLRALFENLH